MRISDWSSDVCSSDLLGQPARLVQLDVDAVIERADPRDIGGGLAAFVGDKGQRCINRIEQRIGAHRHRLFDHFDAHIGRSEEHTSELQSLMRISYAVFCLKKKIKTTYNNQHHNK